MKVRCDHCGKEFDKRPSRVERSENHFCNDTCHHLWQKCPVISGNCDYCGKSLTRPAREWHRSQHHFCDHACYGKWISENKLGSQHPKWTRIDTTCAYCGKPIQHKRCHFEQYENHFCNNKCKGAFRKKVMHVVCDFCGQAIERWPSRVTRFDQHFCNNDCSSAWHVGENNPSWQGGGELYYGPNWNQQRKRARQRDYHYCRICGVSENELGQALDVHHLIPFRKFGIENYGVANCLANLRCLCRKHHLAIEKFSLNEQIQRFIAPTVVYTT